MIELTQEDLIKVKKKHKSVHYDETEINRIQPSIFTELTGTNKSTGKRHVQKKLSIVSHFEPPSQP